MTIQIERTSFDKDGNCVCDVYETLRTGKKQIVASLIIKDHHQPTQTLGAFSKWLLHAFCMRDMSFQPRVNDWAERCFGDNAFDKQERLDRCAEEFLEMLQAFGYTPERLQLQIDRTFSRPAGTPS